MPSGFEDTQAKEPKERTHWLWLGVAVVFLVLVALLMFQGRAGRNVSEVRAKHILIKCDQNDPADRSRALETISSLREQILAGASFSKLAKDFSDDPQSAARGGDLGFFPKGSFDENFEEYVWEAPEGELSDIIKTSHGFHLIVVVDRRLSAADKYEMELQEKAIDTLDETPPPPDDARQGVPAPV